MLIRIRDELVPALTAVMKRGVAVEPDRRLRRDAEDALVEIERGRSACSCANWGAEE